MRVNWVETLTYLRGQYIHEGKRGRERKNEMSCTRSKMGSGLKLSLLVDIQGSLSKNQNNIFDRKKGDVESHARL